ncbi:late competence development ComFB family protein [Clostridium sp. cel8]|uniref:late competence development ComFB family protein n=1 Tax=unclassified Clostridium TaxID=2614128 RepID=UPI0015F4C1D4|nr:late competence development ComFB family protein [Clostridium sp. cel8]MBA5849972.1 late competence development ComFB family protein [Clostridium sp. cel8]
MIKNYMETVIDTLLPEILKNYDNICKCPICLNDMKALVLNRIPPKYFSTEKGLLYSKSNMISEEFRTNIIKEIALAIDTVSKNPSHDIHKTI